MAVCVWCHEHHDTALYLCPPCEELAKVLKKKRGAPLK